MISIIIPAYNEEKLIALSVGSALAAARALGGPHECIVVDDASSDRTAAIARECGARVESVRLRHIAAVRNAGARASRGDRLFFLDADTVLPERVLRAAVAALDRGAVGGGARVDFDEIPLSLRIFWRTFAYFYHLAGLAAGCFVFSRRDAFEAVGGFDEAYFASEEVHLSRALRKRGRFVILRERVATSGRKCRMYTPRQMFLELFRMLWRGRAGLKRRECLDIWYSGKRE